MRIVTACLLVALGTLVLPLLRTALPASEQASGDHPQQRTTFYPPSVYMQTFIACSSHGPCTRTEKFRIESIPNGCCVLSVANGDGQGADEVRSYEVFLNGTTVIPEGHSRDAQGTVKLRRSNTLMVILNGEPHSKVFVLVGYDPGQSH
jgi:hypothetical protein